MIHKQLFGLTTNQLPTDCRFQLNNLLIKFSNYCSCIFIFIILKIGDDNKTFESKIAAQTLFVKRMKIFESAFTAVSAKLKIK